MSNTIKIAIGALVVLIVGLGIGYEIQQSYGSSNNYQNLGAIGGKLAENYDPYLKINGGYLSNLPISINSTFTQTGMTQSASRISMFNSTTTNCAFLSPASTSTVDYASFQITTATSSALTWVISTSTTAFATTSNLATFTVGGGSYFSGAWYPTSTNTGILAPSTYVVVGNQGGPGGFPTLIGGTCSAEFYIL